MIIKKSIFHSPTSVSNIIIPKIIIRVYFLYFILDDIVAKQKYIKCLVSEESQCDVKFKNETEKDNLMLIFRHLLNEHAGAYLG